MSDSIDSTFQYERRPDGIVYRRSPDDKLSRQCDKCSSWIGLGPHGGDYSYRLHRGSSTCIKAEKAREKSRATEKRSGDERVLSAPRSTTSTSPISSPSVGLSPLSPFNASSPQQLIRPASSFVSPSSLYHAHPSPLPSFPPPSWSAPSSPQLFSTPLPHFNRELVLPSLTLESTTLSPPVLTLTPVRHECRGSLVLWEPGDPATTYPYNLHSTNLDNRTRLPWQATVGERPNSVRLRSDECRGTCVMSQASCDPCTKIQLSATYQKIVDWARTDHKHRAYNRINWEQAVDRVNDKSAQLTTERTKVRLPEMYTCPSDRLFRSRHLCGRSRPRESDQMTGSVSHGISRSATTRTSIEYFRLQ